MKQILEAIWNDAKVRCPKHIVWWSETSDTGESKSHQEAPDLFYAKGRPVKPNLGERE